MRTAGPRRCRRSRRCRAAACPASAGFPAVGSAAAAPRRYVAVLRPILEPASFTAADGSVYVMEGGSFVEQ